MNCPFHYYRPRTKYDGRLCFHRCVSLNRTGVHAHGNVHDQVFGQVLGGGYPKSCHWRCPKSCSGGYPCTEGAPSLSEVPLSCPEGTPCSILYTKDRTRDTPLSRIEINPRQDRRYLPSQGVVSDKTMVTPGHVGTTSYPRQDWLRSGQCASRGHAVGLSCLLKLIDLMLENTSKNY